MIKLRAERVYGIQGANFGHVRLHVLLLLSEGAKCSVAAVSSPARKASPLLGYGQIRAPTWTWDCPLELARHRLVAEAS